MPFDRLKRRVVPVAPMPAGKGKVLQAPEVRTIERMQQAYGNRSVRGMLQRKSGCAESQESCLENDEEKQRLQPKLAVSAPEEKLEREADRISTEIGEAPAGPATRLSLASLSVARLAAEGTTSPAPSSVAKALAAPARPLDRAARAFFEPRFGMDLSHIRVHTGNEASRSAHDVNALAYTVGNHIVFREGQYSHSSAAGHNLLAHELVHTLQQSGAPALMRRYAHPDCAAEPDNKWIDKITVNQATPQTITVHWKKNDGTDGGEENDKCSTGKGHCCVAPGAGQGGTCSPARSLIGDTNCTPIGPKTVKKHVYDHSGVMYWTEIDSNRAIALHEYFPVDGTPLSHGCVRLNHDMAVKVFCGARDFATRVTIVNEARPMCNHGALQKEWEEDFANAAIDPLPKDGESRRQVLETRKELEDAFGRKHTPAEYAAMTATDIPRCYLATVAEEKAAEKGTKAAPSPQQQLLGSSGFGKLVDDFEKDLRKSRSLEMAKKAVETHAAKVRKETTSQIQAPTAEPDDQARYLARLRMMRILRLWSPISFKLPVDQHDALLKLFEDITSGR
jgi:hypothetical protein